MSEAEVIVLDDLELDPVERDFVGVLARADLILRAIPTKLTTLACLVLGAVFVLRAIGEFRTLGFFKTITGTDFAFWDTWLYTPLCLMIGLGALWLATTPRAR